MPSFCELPNQHESTDKITCFREQWKNAHSHYDLLLLLSQFYFETCLIYHRGKPHIFRVQEEQQY